VQDVGGAEPRGKTECVFRRIVPEPVLSYPRATQVGTTKIVFTEEKAIQITVFPQDVDGAEPRGKTEFAFR